MLQHVDYRTSADTGEIDNVSIAPVTDGEAAKQLNFRRPTENNRARLEVLRDTEREHLLLRDAVPTALWGGGTVTFNGAKATYSGTFTISADMYLGPFQTAGDGVGSSAPYIGSTKAMLTLGTTGVNQLFITSVKKQFEGTTLMKADANRISVEILHDTSTSIVLEGASGEVNNIKITIISGTTTVQQLVDLINNDVTVTQYVTAAKEGTTPGAAAAPLWGPTQWGSDYGLRFLRGGMSGITHKITAANLSAFFATVANTLQKGDTVAIWYDKMVDKTGVGGRMQSTAENGNTTIPTASIFNTRVNPEYIPGCIPICKCLDNDTLLFVDGTYIKRTSPGTIGAGAGPENGSLLNIMWDVIGTGPYHNPATTVRQALNNIDGTLLDVTNEVNGARTSPVFGTFSTVGQRLDKADYHARAYISVGPNCMYTSLQTALLAEGRTSVGGKGGLFLVRQGLYVIDTPIALDTHCEIIAVEDNTQIKLSTSGNYAITFSATATLAKSRISGFVVHNETAPASGCFIDVANGAKNVIIENIYLQHTSPCTSNPAIIVSGQNVLIQNVQCQMSGQKSLQISTSARRCDVDNFECSGGPAEALRVAGSMVSLNNIYIESCSPPAFHIASTSERVCVQNLEVIYGVGDSAAQVLVEGYRVNFHNVKISDCEGPQFKVYSCSEFLMDTYQGMNFAVGYTHIELDTVTNATLRNFKLSSTSSDCLLYVDAEGFTLERVQFTCTLVGSSSTGIVHLTGQNFHVNGIVASCTGGNIACPIFKADMCSGTFDNLDLYLGAGSVTYTLTGYNPVYFRSRAQGTIHIRNLNVHNWQFPNDAYVRDAPVITLYPDGVNSRVILEGGQVDGMTDTGTPALGRSGYIMGSIASAYVPQGAGSLTIRDFNFDLNGLNAYGYFDEYICVANLPSHSIVDHCIFVNMGAALAYGIVARGKDHIIIRDNSLYCYNDEVKALILLRDNGTGANPECCIIEGNTCHHGAGMMGVTDIIVISGYDGTYQIQRPRVLNNTCVKHYASSWTGASIRFDGVNKGTVFNNNVSNGIVYGGTTSGMLPAVGALGTHNILA